MRLQIFFATALFCVQDNRWFLQRKLGKSIDKKTWHDILYLTRKLGKERMVFFMEKKEILERAQNKKKGSMDEWELQVAQKGFRFALMGILLVSLVLMTAKIIAGQPWSDVYCIFFVGMGIHYLHNGAVLHKKFEAGLGILAVLASAMLLAGYIIEIFR